MTLRILHAPALVGGNPMGLARAEREIGLDSRCVALVPGAYGYEADEVLLPADASALRREAARWSLLRRARRDFDVVHLNFGQTLLPSWTPPGAVPDERVGIGRRLFRTYARAVEQRDLPWLKRAGKGVVVTFQGDDARQGDRLAAFEPSLAREVEPGYYTPASDEQKRRRIARFAEHADRVFALNPDLLRVLPEGARFLPYAHVDPREWKADPRPSDGPPLVVHAPTHRGVKGTRHVLAAVERLRKEGVDFRFRLVEGLPRAEAQRAYAEADLLVDQLVAGWYGGLAVELMALGRPVVAHVREADLELLPPGMRADLPVLDATPATIERVLREWLVDRRAELPRLGARSRAYVERWHDPLRIARDLETEYEAIVGA